MTLLRVWSVDREPIVYHVYNDNEPKRVQTSEDDTSRFPARPASREGSVLEKRGSQKGLGDASVSFHPTDDVNLAR